MMCYRRFGHNEGDEPSYTQPKMYRRIENRRSVRKLYTEALVNRGDITLEEAEAALQDFQSRLQSAFDETRQSTMTGVRARPAPEPIGVLPHIDTGIERSTFDTIIESLDTVPEDFHVHPKLARQFETRRKVIEGGEIDWAVGEALAFGSLLMEGTDVRLTGQDTRRGTFSQRHSVLVCNDTEDEWTPLAHLGEGQGKLWIYDSLLSEYAALGFEYGYSVAHKDALVGWEAQFGDFVNGAQIIIDQFLVAAEDKWGQTSGLVMLLPHGFEGQGPEHSSARLERFLTLSAEDNIQVVNPTTSASYFHVLRRQMHRDIRKPLIVFTPKSLLRAKEARSPVDVFLEGSFEEMMDDPSVTDRDAVRRLVVCSGKIVYDALRARDEIGAPAAVVRAEQLYPWPAQRLTDILETYPNVSEVVWLQEEPSNMGAWPFVHEKLHRLPRDRYTVRHVSRSESGSPAAGSLKVHQQEQEEIVAKAFAGLS
jgi:2-oxoglutarate decarboxylase